ncbi:Uncharacterized protein Cob_v006604 [Colletotrichum orbiculare MAFF 240422]|uniref:Uncharacterized protein n=1 Tax=Colletotrichum orbiculare (strain 104-T / ATCC 96160 / CBS 514.97 / LARS 414 / MAFF 240422) TaxID=1213857 RepID=N4V8G4_COLOR|nr:Uncharacterized protein Cob_v006604 [Colletotrichum orbiculare MAFF 240422]
MDAHALLSSQGWRGKGHSLHATDDAIGLSKPLLLNRKDNTKGLGTKAHFTSDTWWMNAFDEQLQGLDTSKKGRVTQTVTSGRLNQVEKVSGGKWMLYASFVRGGFLDGTIKGGEDTTPESSDSGKEKEERRGETKEEKRVRKAARKARREAKEKRKAARDDRRRVRAEKRAEKETRRVGGETRQEKRARRAAKKAKREESKTKASLA